MKLSDNFSLGEFLVSQTAARHGLDMTPSDSVIANLKRLCRDVLQPLRDDLRAPIIITSGYRPAELNRMIGGSPNSQHITGQAADIRAVGYLPVDVFELATGLDLPIDQAIEEFQSWVHLSIPAAGEPPRRQLLSAVREDGRTVYREA